MRLGSANFDSYARNLRRLHWMEFLDAQVRLKQRHTFRASLISPSCEPSLGDVNPDGIEPVDR
ncbi:MAG: hypothetical protein AAFV69_10715 [Pseudomonadota bacterium]